MARGSIRPIQRKGKDGKSYQIYRARVPAGETGAGKRRQLTRHFRTRREADAWVSEQLAALASGRSIVAERMTVAELFARWLPLHERKVRPSTARCDRWAWGVIAPALGHVRLDRLTPLMVQAFYDGLTPRFKPWPIKTLHRVFAAALDQAVAWEVIGRNPAKATTRPAVVSEPRTVWTAAQAQRFLNETRDDFDGPLFALLLWTGVRIGEALALDWRHVDLDGGWLTVERTMTKTADGQTIVGTRAKSRASHRRIPLALPAQAALRRQLAAQEQRRGEAGDWWIESGAVFDAGDGSRRTDGGARGRMARLVDRLGLPPLSPHGLRHCCASLLYKRRVPVRQIQALLGHSSSQVTLDLYAHLFPDDQEEVARAMEDLLTPTTTTGDPPRPTDDAKSS